MLLCVVNYSLGVLYLISNFFWYQSLPNNCFTSGVMYLKAQTSLHLCFDLKSTSYNFINELEARFKIKRKLMSIIIHPCYNLQQKVTCAITSWEEHVHEYIKNQISKIYIFRGPLSRDLAFRLEIHTNQLPFSPYYKRTNIFLYQCFRLGAYYNIAFC